MHLHVRPENVRRLKKLAALSAPQFAEVLEVLERKVATLANGQALLDATSDLKLSPPADAIDVAEATLPLLFTYVAEGHKPAEVVAAVMSGLRDQGTSAERFNAKDSSVLKGRLSLILGSRTLALKAKAAALVLNRGSILSTARILTDVRPVFALQSASSVEAFTIIHTLVLDVSEGESDRSIHIAVDRSDLAALKKAIERAEKKDATISKWAGATGVVRIEVD